MEMHEPWDPQFEFDRIKNYTSSLSENDRNRYITLKFFGPKKSGSEYSDEECSELSLAVKSIVESNTTKTLQEYLSQFPIKYYDGNIGV